ncbi:MAG TPA: efflux transporter outer membrane subunit [Candidatus Aquilonibacter sp.]|jgi:NodT family efflux transporter outer membrane factor (OMF) lipoprotein|nr:efflux transporter outer membrane subunit [Candidatus Aquilonibacter sp.]
MNILRQKPVSYIVRLGAVALTLMLSACVVGPKYHAPTPQAPAAYKESPTQFKEDQGWTVAQPADAKLRGKWWEIFNDPELNALEEQLDINNQNIKLYFENFMEARAVVREARSQYFPTLSVAPSVNHSRPSANLGAGAVAGAGATTTTTATPVQSTVYSLPLEASWEPDLWGKVRNTVREAQYAAQVSAADLENERLTEQASLAQYFFEIRGQDKLQQIFDETVKADEKSLELTRSLYDSGIDDQISVVEAETTLKSAQAGATNVGIARAQYEHAIAVLLGKVASNFSIPPKPMTVVPPPIPIGIPSELLERRPDIAAAERTMAEANATIGIAYAAYYPDLTLTGEAGFESSIFSKWLSWPSRFWSVGASLPETIFDAGLRRATVQQYVATYNADLANYRQTVLSAFQQVEDGLAEVRILSKEIQQEQEAVDAAQTFLKLEQGRYDTGIDPYIDVLVAQTTVLADQQTLNGLQVQQMTYAVALIESLGGGWDRSQLPGPKQVTQKPDKGETTIQQ